MTGWLSSVVVEDWDTCDCVGIPLGSSYLPMSRAIQFARAMGCMVIAIDGGAKREVCKQLGAHHFIAFTTSSNTVQAVNDILSKYNTTKSIVLALVGSPDAYRQGIEMLGHGGTFVCVGLRTLTEGQLPRSLLIKSSFQIFRASNHTVSTLDHRSHNYKCCRELLVTDSGSFALCCCPQYSTSTEGLLNGRRLHSPRRPGSAITVPLALNL